MKDKTWGRKIRKRRRDVSSGSLKKDEAEINGNVFVTSIFISCMCYIFLTKSRPQKETARTD